MPDSEEHTLHQATIISRAGESTGKCCNWYNIQCALPKVNRAKQLHYSMRFAKSKSGQATALDLIWEMYWNSLLLQVQTVHPKCTVYPVDENSIIFIHVG